MNRGQPLSTIGSGSGSRDRSSEAASGLAITDLCEGWFGSLDEKKKPFWNQTESLLKGSHSISEPYS